MTVEEMERGAVEWSTIATYIKAAGGYCKVLFVLLLAFIYAGSQAFNYYWLSYWIEHGSGVCA